MTLTKKQALRHDFETIANRYADALLDQFGLTWDSAWWVGNQVGGVFCFGEVNSVTFDELLFIVDNGITFKEYDDFIDYNLSMMDLGLNYITFERWYNERNILSKETINNLLEKKKELDEAIKESAIKSLISFD